MNTNDITQLLLNTATDFGTYVFIIITATISVAVAYLIFKIGWQNVKNSLSGGSPGFIDPFADANSMGASSDMSDDSFERDWAKYKKTHKNANKETFSEIYFDV